MILINSDLVFALRINEVELNPTGKDAGFEWVELYSEESIDLGGYILYNGDGGSYNLSGTFSGYLTVIFPGAWLDNSNETVFLKSGVEIISETPHFNDAKNNDKAWSFCEEWKFISGTQNAANACDGGTQVFTQAPENDTEEDSGLSYLTNSDLNNSEGVLPTASYNLPNVVSNTNSVTDNKPNKITLNKAKQGDEKVIVTKTYKTRVGVIYAFLGLCVLLVVLISLRKL